MLVGFIVHLYEGTAAQPGTFHVDDARHGGEAAGRGRITRRGTGARRARSGAAGLRAGASARDEQKFLTRDLPAPGAHVVAAHLAQRVGRRAYVTIFLRQTSSKSVLSIGLAELARPRRRRAAIDLVGQRLAGQRAPRPRVARAGATRRRRARCARSTVPSPSSLRGDRGRQRRGNRTSRGGAASSRRCASRPIDGMRIVGQDLVGPPRQVVDAVVAVEVGDGDLALAVAPTRA